MSLLGKAIRANTIATPTEDIIAAFGGVPSYSGKTVTISNSLTLIPVFRAVTLLSTIGTLPLEVFRRTGYRTQEFASDSSRPWSLLHDKPNEQMSAAECWKIVIGHLATWGNAFLWKERGPDGRIANLWPIDPARVLVGRDTELKPIFLIQTYAATPPGSTFIEQGTEVLADDSEILHIRGLSRDGLVGYSPVQLARQTLGTMMAQEEFAGKFWANDATPGGILTHPNKLTPEATERVKQLWKKAHKGSSKAREVAVLGEGMTFQQTTMPLEDAQFIQLSNFHRTDVALLFGLPPGKLGGNSGDSMRYTNTEAESLDFVKWTARDYMVSVEGALSWDQDLMPSKWFAKFCADDLLRGSKSERYAAYAVAPHLLVDEVRADDDMPPLPDGKGQVFSKTIAPPRGTVIPVQDEPLGDQPTPGQGEEPGAAPAKPTVPLPTKEPKKP